MSVFKFDYFSLILKKVIMTTKTIYLMVFLTFLTKVCAQNIPDAIEDLNFKSSEYVELNQIQEIAFDKHLIQLNNDRVYRCVTDQTCKKYKSGILNIDEEEITDYPLQVVFKKAINFKDKFIIKFELDNCVGGNTYYRDFAFFSKNTSNEIIYNKTLTNDLKDKFYQFVISKFNEGDRLCYSNEHNYIFTSGLNIVTVNNNIVYGKYVLYGINAPNCCPEYNGKFNYNIITRKVLFIDEQHASAFEDEMEMRDDEITIIDWTHHSFEENVKLEREPVAFKNTKIKLTIQQKEALKQFIALCKINVNIEDSWNLKNSLLIINALGIKEVSIPKEEIKTQLDKILLDENLRNSFLNAISRMSGAKDEYTYFFIESFNVPNIVSMKPNDIVTLSNLINNNYKYSTEALIQSNSDTQNEDSIKYIAIENEAVFEGGEQNYFSSRLRFPNINDLDKKISGIIVKVSLEVLEDGSIVNFSFTSNIRIKSEYTYNSNEKEVLTNKYSPYFENEIAKVLEKMPKWTPAQSQGQNIKSRVNFPVKFIIQD